MNELLASAKEARDVYRTALNMAIDREQALLRTAIENHSSMPDNYWQERFRLTRKVEAVNALVEVLTEEQRG